MALDNCETGSGDAVYEPRYKSNEITKLEFFSNGRVMEKELFESYVEENSLKIKPRFDGNGNHDSKPISLLGLGTIKQLEKESVQLNPARFRANIYTEWEDAKQFYEES